MESGISTTPEPSTKDENAKTFEAATRHIFYTGRFLPVVLKSAAFKRHIEFLVKHIFLVIPVASLQKEYCAFANLRNIPF